MIGQLGLNFDLSAGVFLLFLVLPTVLFFGCLFGVLALISDSPSRWKPLALSIAAILISAIFFSVTIGLDHGFKLGTLFGMVPGLLGTWGIAQSLCSPSMKKASAGQFSTRLILRFILCIAIALAIMAFLERETQARRRLSQAVQLLTHAKTLIATPAMLASDPGAIATPEIGKHQAIKLCSQAIVLAPHLGEAYHVRATAYEQMGDARSAEQDRLRAIELGHKTSAQRDTEPTDSPAPE